MGSVGRVDEPIFMHLRHEYYIKYKGLPETIICKDDKGNILRTYLKEDIEKKKQEIEKSKETRE